MSPFGWGYFGIRFWPGTIGGGRGVGDLADGVMSHGRRRQGPAHPVQEPCQVCTLGRTGTSIPTPKRHSDCATEKTAPQHSCCMLVSALSSPPMVRVVPCVRVPRMPACCCRILAAASSSARPRPSTASSWPSFCRARWVHAPFPPCNTRIFAAPESEMGMACSHPTL